MFEIQVVVKVAGGCPPQGKNLAGDGDLLWADETVQGVGIERGALPEVHEQQRQNNHPGAGGRKAPAARENGCNTQE